ncbi:MAG: geranylgeranyl diphosphate reductase [Hyphomicrobiales bacterium]|nr:geranylgeranyl diphosphate reductase [Hyphomicrobiales bacterium]
MTPGQTPHYSAYDVVVVGGGPAGSTAAAELASAGHRVLLLDRAGRVKPCGGAIPTKLIGEFAIPKHLLTAHIRSARIFAPSKASVDMRIDNGFVGMVDREVFDPWLRERARTAGAEVVVATFRDAARGPDGQLAVTFDGNSVSHTVSTRLVVGADGANSSVRRLLFGKGSRPPYVFAYHEIVRSPAGRQPGFDPQRCDVYYQSPISPDFYGWVFPHGETISVGVGSAVRGFDLRAATRLLREQAGLVDQETIREEGAPLPLKPLRRWDNGRDAVLVGDAAGVVAPSSGEGIYYAMLCGRLASEAAAAFLATGDAKALAQVRKRFMRLHGRVFMVLGFMQRFWYRNDKRRERFVAICEDPDVQRLVWESYLNKRFVRTDPIAHLRVFFKDIGHLLRMAFQ